MSEKKIRLAMIGGGAVTELRHLPALAGRLDCEVIVLVDSNRARAEELASQFGIPQVFTDYRASISSGIDAAVVTLPNHLHASASVDFLMAGIHVMVEKPMARTVAECNTMLAAADSRGAILAVGLTRRFMQCAQFAKQAIDTGLLGRIRSFDIQDGFLFNWPLASDFFFRREAAGGGVLIDTGVHTLDQVLWWFGDVRSFEYYDDNFGGVETNCEILLKLQSGVEGRVELSRTRNLRNTAIIRGESAELEVGLARNFAALRLPNTPVQIIGQGASADSSRKQQSNQVELFIAEYDDFFDAIRRSRKPAVCGLEGSRSVTLIETCYCERQPLSLPWDLPAVPTVQEVMP
jgi:predicted dehydrogenase